MAEEKPVTVSLWTHAEQLFLGNEASKVGMKLELWLRIALWNPKFNLSQEFIGG